MLSRALDTENTAGCRPEGGQADRSVHASKGVAGGRRNRGGLTRAVGKVGYIYKSPAAIRMASAGHGASHTGCVVGPAFASSWTVGSRSGTDLGG